MQNKIINEIKSAKITVNLKILEKKIVQNNYVI